ncbi:metallophosphoesterase [Xanthobacter versatilis]|uniref:Metallophosphoesterase n=1 Tax=Xanthobacter autotrophicus (strain ATCC BAA-1158 / Py2) TaxID=78245 RepID=A7ILW2_XANP2|nr:metallophosphoesterase [Xanthobacter autotrophicus Py2]
MAMLKLRPNPLAEAAFAPPVPRLPPNKRVYAVGDIHGHLDLLKRLQAAIDEDMLVHPGVDCIEVYLGDYVDRGPQSAAVIDALIERQASRKAVCISGNHEAVMIDALLSRETFARWLKMGGLETVFSYVGHRRNLDENTLWSLWRAAVSSAHLAFLKRLSSHFVCGDYLFVHAGLRPGIPLEEQSREDMMWIRREFLDCPDWLGHCVVHGHTPTKVPEVLPNRINIDTGAYASGHLTCLVLEGADCFHITT